MRIIIINLYLFLSAALICNAADEKLSVQDSLLYVWGWMAPSPSTVVNFCVHPDQDSKFDKTHEKKKRIESGRILKEDFPFHRINPEITPYLRFIISSPSLFTDRLKWNAISLMGYCGNKHDLSFVHDYVRKKRLLFQGNYGSYMQFFGEMVGCMFQRKIEGAEKIAKKSLEYILDINSNGRKSTWDSAKNRFISSFNLYAKTDLFVDYYQNIYQDTAVFRALRVEQSKWSNYEKHMIPKVSVDEYDERQFKYSQQWILEVRFIIKLYKLIKLKEARNEK